MIHRSAWFAAAALAVIVGASPILGDDRTADETSARTEPPATLDRPVDLKPYYLSPPPRRLKPTDEQRAVDYRSQLKGEIKRLERRQGYRRDRRGFDRMQNLRRERSRIDRIIRR